MTLGAERVPTLAMAAPAPAQVPLHLCSILSLLILFYFYFFAGQLCVSFCRFMRHYGIANVATPVPAVAAGQCFAFSSEVACTRLRSASEAIVICIAISGQVDLALFFFFLDRLCDGL